MTENTLLDADSHVSEPLNLWRERLPVKYRDIAPHMETEHQGRPGAWWFIEQDRQPHNVILGFGANKSLEELQQLLKSFSYAGAHRGGWDPAQRVKDMDQDGVAGDVLYTTLGFRMFWIRDAGFQRACFQVYNDWLAEFCAYSPKRLKGLALISLYDPKQAAEDLADCAKKGLAGALVWASPPEELPFYSEDYDPFWAAAQELSMPLSLPRVCRISVGRLGLEREETNHSRGYQFAGGGKDFCHFDTFRRARAISTPQRGFCGVELWLVPLLSTPLR